MTSSPVTSAAEVPAASEHAVKAALVFKIAKFVSWPDRAFAGLSEPLSVCVHEDDPLADALSTLTGKPIHGRAFSVRHFDESLFTSRDCQILLVTKTYSEKQLALLETISNLPILTIIDNDHLADHDGIIGIKINNNHVRFAINVAASESAGLDISAQLLQLAEVANGRKGT